MDSLANVQTNDQNASLGPLRLLAGNWVASLDSRKTSNGDKLIPHANKDRRFKER